MRRIASTSRFVLITLAATAVGVVPSCTDYQTVDGILTGGGFVARSIQERVFIDGAAITTVAYPSSTPDSPTVDRTPLGVDFNGDGAIDAVACYGGDQAVIQILLSSGTGSFLSLTLDSAADMQDLADVAVGDIDGDGRLDIVAGAKDALWYYRQPAEGPTYLRGWGNQDDEDLLYEQIDASVLTTDATELNALILATVGPTVNINDYTITITSTYSNVEIGDFDQDGWNDVAATRTFIISLEPRPTANVSAIEIVDGGLSIFLNPGAAIDGHEWASVTIGRHERQTRPDADGGRGMIAYDLDDDGDLDLIAATSKDNNVQVAWWENPGPALIGEITEWTQWRIGSIRDAWALDIADVDGDGRMDVVASGPEQMQVLLFRQPTTGPKREYDWDASTLVTFETYQPYDVKVIDLDFDGRQEVVVGCNQGAVRYFTQPSNIADEWDVNFLADFDPTGTIGLMGFGDLDGDTDIDLIVVIDGDEPNGSRTAWLRNDM